MEQLLKIMKDESNDRYIFITYDNDNIVGLNFHQGITKRDMHIDYYYAKPCPYTTETFLRMIRLYKRVYTLVSKLRLSHCALGVSAVSFSP
jgi:hypothetical protein